MSIFSSFSAATFITDTTNYISIFSFFICKTKTRLTERNERAYEKILCKTRSKVSFGRRKKLVWERDYDIMVECISRGAWVTQLCRVAFFRRHDHLQWFFFSHVTTQFIDNSSILVIDAISEATMRLPISWERSVYRRCLELISQWG